MVMPAVAASESIEDAVRACLRRILPRRLSKQPLHAETHLFSDLGLDSMQLLELISLLEEVVGRPITEQDLKKQPIETVGQATAFVSLLLSAA
jgi:acyl carrier protein